MSSLAAIYHHLAIEVLFCASADISYHLTDANGAPLQREDDPKVRKFLDSWSSLTPAFADAIAQGVPDVKIPPPGGVAGLEGIAKLKETCNLALKGLVAGGMARDPNRSPTLFENPSVPHTLAALASLSEAEADAYAAFLLDQQQAWQEAGVASSRPFEFVIPDRLAELAAFHGPLASNKRERAEELSASHRQAIKLQPGEDLSQKATDIYGQKGLKISYLPSGVTLEELGQVEPLAGPVAAGHLGFLSVGISKRKGSSIFNLFRGSREPKGADSGDNVVLLVLDIDLTSPDMAFLGLKGTRLRICDRASWGGFETPLFTRVSLDGGVELLEALDHPPCDLSGVTGDRFAVGRPLLSPFEGLRSAGRLGSEWKIGGAANWDQYPEDPVSPVSGAAMTFIAQFEHPLGGKAYCFLDYENLIATVIEQGT